MSMSLGYFDLDGSFSSEHVVYKCLDLLYLENYIFNWQTDQIQDMEDIMFELPTGANLALEFMGWSSCKPLQTHSTHSGIFIDVAWLDFSQGLHGSVYKLCLTDISLTLLGPLTPWSLLLYSLVTSCNSQHSLTQLPPEWRSNQKG